MASIYVICAILGNMWRESHVNPNCGEAGGGSGWGLGQWTGQRRLNLFNFLQSQGLNYNDGYGQLDFLVVENDWINRFGEFNSLQDFLNSDSTDINYLTKVYMKCWERPGVEALEERQQFAIDMYSFLINGGTYEGAWILEPVYYLSRAQAYNNGYLVYQWFSGVIPPDPPAPPTPDPPETEINFLLLAKKNKKRRKKNANTIISKFQ